MRGHFSIWLGLLMICKEDIVNWICAVSAGTTSRTSCTTRTSLARSSWPSWTSSNRSWSSRRLRIRPSPPTSRSPSCASRGSSHCQTSSLRFLWLSQECFKINPQSHTHPVTVQNVLGDWLARENFPLCRGAGLTFFLDMYFKGQLEDQKSFYVL